MKKIKLTQGKYAIVDDEDYFYLSRFSWQFHTNEKFKYANVSRRVFYNRYQKQKGFCDIALESYILPDKVNLMIMHKNGDWLDFRKKNLFYGSINLSKHSSTKAENKSSIYKGVSKEKTEASLWRGMITKRIDGKRVCFRKSFVDEKKAALWYNKKAKEMYGEFAYQNKI